MTTDMTFSRQNDVGSRKSATSYRENLVLVVILVSNLKLSNILQSVTLLQRTEAQVELDLIHN